MIAVWIKQQNLVILVVELESNWFTNVKKSLVASVYALPTNVDVAQ
jgi:hypothetical protein